LSHRLLDQENKVMRSCNNVLLILQILFTVCITSRAFSAPIIENKKRYYSVQGKTAAEIRRSLNKHSPVVVKNRRYGAYTRWFFSWKIDYVNSNGNCTISKITTRVKINHILPKITNEFPSSLDNKWRKYFHALLDHESGHANMGIKAATEIEKNISNLPSFPQCTALEKETNKLGQTIIRKYITLEKKYDTDTQYGATSGAVFP
jgi:predicted secreted Zn-dependent protease